MTGRRPMAERMQSNLPAGQAASPRGGAGGHSPFVHLLGAIGTGDGEGEEPAASIPLDAGRGALGVQLGAVRRHLAHERLGDEGVEAAAEHGGAAEEEVGVRAEAVQDPGHLHGDVAGADHRHPLGLLLQVEEAVAGDGKLRPRDFGAGRLAPRRQQDVRGRDSALAAIVQLQLERVRAEERRSAHRHLAARLQKRHVSTRPPQGSRGRSAPSPTQTCTPCSAAPRTPRSGP